MKKTKYSFASILSSLPIHISLESDSPLTHLCHFVHKLP